MTASSEPTWFWLGETLTPVRLFGIAMIVVGVCAVGLGTYKAA